MNVCESLFAVWNIMSNLSSHIMWFAKKRLCIQIFFDERILCDHKTGCAFSYLNPHLLLIRGCLVEPDRILRSRYPTYQLLTDTINPLHPPFHSFSYQDLHHQFILRWLMFPFTRETTVKRGKSCTCFHIIKFFAWNNSDLRQSKWKWTHILNGILYFTIIKWAYIGL